MIELLAACGLPGLFREVPGLEDLRISVTALPGSGQREAQAIASSVLRADLDHPVPSDRLPRRGKRPPATCTSRPKSRPALLLRADAIESPRESPASGSA